MSVNRCRTSQKQCTNTMQLSTRADRQDVNISFTVCLFVCLIIIIIIRFVKRQNVKRLPWRCLFVCVCVCVCTVTDFSAEDKASGVTFCMAVYRRPRQEMYHFCVLCSPRSPKSDKSASARATPTPCKNYR